MIATAQHKSIDPGFWFCLQWVLSCSGLGVGVFLAVSVNGDLAVGLAAFGGVIIGLVQAFALRTYISKQFAVQWVFSTGVGWFAAMAFLFFGNFIAGVGSGLNNFDPRSLEIEVCVVAGAIFGSLQRLFVPVFSAPVWIAINAFTWGISIIFGGAIALVLDNRANEYAIFSPLSTGAGAIAAISLFGVVTGLAALKILRSKNENARAPTMEANNPVNRWRRIIVDETKSWVLFEYGTCVILPHPEGNLAAQARALLAEWGPVHVGTPSADFNVVDLVHEPGWIVTCHHPDILAYVSPEEFGTTDPPDITIGLLGREMRAQDASDLSVVHVEDRESTNV
jgi:hypothetical protein